MTGTPRFAKLHVFILHVADLSDGRISTFVDNPDFTGGQAKLRITIVPGHQRRGCASLYDNNAGPKAELPSLTVLEI